MKTGKAGKRAILIAILSSLIITMTYGQAGLIVLILGDKVATENFYLSIDGALNISALSNLDKGNLKPGLNYGLGAHIKLSEKFSLRPEFKPLSQKGAKSVNLITPVPVEIDATKTDIKLNYIDVPVFLQYNVTPKFFVSAGPQISFLTKSSQYSEGTVNESSDVSINLDTKSLFNNIDFSFPVEIGYSISLSTKKSTSKINANIYVRYSYGFTEVFKDTSVGSAKNSVFQFGVSLPFIKSPEELAKIKKK
jgi:hypothetical protein